MEKVLVVGGAGYVGGITSDLLADRNFQVTVYDSLLYEHRFLKELDFINGDIRDTERLVAVQKQYDHIIWLAAIVGDGACSQDVTLTYEVNYGALKRFLDRTKRSIFFPSTCSIYGNNDSILNEDSATNPLSAYAKTKLLAEEEVFNHGGTVLRLGTLYGVGDIFSRIRLDLVINVLTYKSIFEKKITVFGGDQWRPVLSVEDVGHYFVEAVERPKNDVFIVAMQNTKIIDLGKIFTQMYPQVKMDVVDMSYEDARNYRVSTKRADTYFSHRPIKTIEREIRRIEDLLVSRRIKDPEDAMYYNTHYVKQMLDEIKQFRPSATDA